MVQLIVFVLVLAAVYAVKAFAISRSHESLAQKSTSFSWARVRPEDEALAAEWATAEEPAPEARVSLGSAPVMRRARA